MAINKRDARVFDVYRVELATGKLTLDTLPKTPERNGSSPNRPEKPAWKSST